MTYEEARKYIEYTDTLGSVLGLDSIKELLRRLGDPQNKVKAMAYMAQLQSCLYYYWQNKTLYL